MPINRIDQLETQWQKHRSPAAARVTCGTTVRKGLYKAKEYNWGARAIRIHHGSYNMDDEHVWKG